MLVFYRIISIGKCSIVQNTTYHVVFNIPSFLYLAEVDFHTSTQHYGLLYSWR